jgi:hypothetical protein
MAVEGVCTNIAACSKASVAIFADTLSVLPRFLHKAGDHEIVQWLSAIQDHSIINHSRSETLTLFLAVISHIADQPVLLC